MLAVRIRLKDRKKITSFNAPFEDVLDIVKVNAPVRLISLTRLATNPKDFVSSDRPNSRTT